MTTNKQKSLLLLGGATHQVCAIEAAKQLDCRTILCDYLPDNPGQYVADVYYQLSTTDFSAISEVARNEAIDGILSYGSDVAAPIAASVSEQMGLATNSSRSVLTLSEKHRFRKFMTECGFPCPRFIEFRQDDCPQNVISKIKQDRLKLPIMIKPTDSSGSKGVTTLSALTVESLADAMQAARRHSRNGILIAEERINASYPYVIGGDVFVVDGIVRFWGLMKCLRDNDLGGLVPVGKAYPSGLDQAQMKRVRDAIQNVVFSLDIKNGPMNVEVIIGPNGIPYIVELAARAGGNLIPLQLQDISGIDLIRPSVQCALGITPDDVSFNGLNKYVVTHVLHSQTDGILEGIHYSETARAHLYREIVYYEEGDEINCFTNAAQSVGIAFFEFFCEKEMDAFIAQLKQHVHLQVRERTLV